MGRSLNSCFKILSCTGDSANKDDALPRLPESKTSPAKYRWSFHKRSAMHHVPSNNVILESVDIVNNKQIQEPASDTINSENALVLQKSSTAEQISATPTVSLSILPWESEQDCDKSNVKVNYSILEDVVVVIQASIRGYLAKRELEKTKKVVKLQAAMRRYFVRRVAVGTLRCLLAIVKIQRIVRARLISRSTLKVKLNEEVIAVKAKHYEWKSNRTLHTVRSIASNAFACQLLKSTLKTKSFYITCNPLKPDSGWIWLERWMALASSDQHTDFSKQDNQGGDIITDLNAYEVNKKIQVTHELVFSDSKLVLNDPAVSVEDAVDLLTNSSEKILFNCPAPIKDQCLKSPIINDQLYVHDEELMSVEKDEYRSSTRVKENSVHRESLLSSDANSEFQLICNSNKPEYSEATHNISVQNNSNETLDMEIGHVVTEFRKSRHSDFAAVQAKFEVLSATSSSNRSFSHSFKGTKSDSKSAHSQLTSNSDNLSELKPGNFLIGTKFNEVSMAENFVSHAFVNQVATLEGSNGSSTTLIADRLYVTLPDSKTSNVNPCIVGSPTDFNNGDIDAKTDTHLCESKEVQQKIMAKNDENLTRQTFAAEPVLVNQQYADSIMSDTLVVVSAKALQVDRSSQDGSPISHVTFPESYETPSSQISCAQAKTAKVESNIPAKKKRPQLVTNDSPTNSINDSNVQTSGEHLKKDAKSTKRRNSFSIIKIDQDDHEHQATSGHLLPSYMQPTESARAKVNASISQKSSSDVYDKDYHIKKRHSLPNGNGKEDSSPRMQRSTSQTQQKLKGNGIHSPNNSTEKRWQR